MAGCLAVVLAAGQGKRLRPLTDARSKPMLPIAGEPMVVRVLEMLARGGVDRFVVVVHPGDHPLVDLLGRPPWAGRVELAYQEQRLGTAHALGCAAPFIRAVDASAFILASCDNVYPDGHVAAMIEQQRERDLDAVLTLMQVQPEVIPTLAVVAVQDGRVTRIVEKPRPEDAPSDLGVPFLYVFSARVLDYLPQVAVSPRGEREVQDALRMLIEEGGVVGGRLMPWRMTLTRPADLLALNRHFLRRDPACATVVPEFPIDVRTFPPVRIEAGVELGSGCRIGPEVYLETGACVGKGATLRQAVVLQGANVGSGAVVEQVVLG